VADTASLFGWVEEMLRDPAAAQAMGDAGLDAASDVSGLPALVAARLLELAGSR
jgi:hypothetical protein